MIDGLNAAATHASIIVSPRNREMSASLAAKFANVRVARTNQEVLDESETVVLAVRPQIAESVLGELRFRADHDVISLVAALPLDRLRKLIAPAASATRAVPIPTVARNDGPTAIYPANRNVEALFESLGTAIVLEEEGVFDSFASATALMASYFAFAGAAVDWMSRNGVSPGDSRRFVDTMLRGLASTASASTDLDYAALADEHQTRGGLNEQVRSQLTRKGMFAEIGDALDAVLQRLRDAHAGS
jgi:pyrroline-5-carboxylate reductase